MNRLHTFFFKMSKCCSFFKRSPPVSWNSHRCGFSIFCHSNVAIQISKQYRGIQDFGTNRYRVFKHRPFFLCGRKNVSTFPNTHTWVDKYVPGWLTPHMYLMRLDKPIGTWLLFWPCAWSIALAATPGFLPNIGLLALFGVGSTVMRGAGCTINDMWDRDIDGKVARTKTRPLVSGGLSMSQAWLSLAVQLSAGLAVLVNLNMTSIFLGIASLPLVAAYPLMKRFTNWPQFVLGLTFNWGALMGYSAALNVIDLSVTLPLYAAGVSWTIFYDTIYAVQDKKDDSALGLRSTALYFGQNVRPIVAGFGLLTMTALAITGHQAGVFFMHLWWLVLRPKEMKGLGSIYYSVIGIGACSQLLWQIVSWKPSDSLVCRVLQL